MAKKSRTFKKIVALSCALLLYGMTPTPGHTFFHWFSQLFSASQKTEAHIFLYEPGKQGQTPKIQSIKQLGRPTMLVLWSVGCFPCIKEMVTLNRLAPDLRAKGGDIVPVLLAPEWNRVIAFLAHMGQSMGKVGQWHDLFPSLSPWYDGKGQVTQNFSPSMVPFVVFLNSKGEVTDTHEGYQDWTLEMITDKLGLS